MLPAAHLDEGPDAPLGGALATRPLPHNSGFVPEMRKILQFLQFRMIACGFCRPSPGIRRWAAACLPGLRASRLPALQVDRRFGSRSRGCAAQRLCSPVPVWP